MKNKVKKMYTLSVIVVGLIIWLFLNIEIQSPKIHHSSVFTTPGNTEIRLCVLMNTLFPVDEAKLVKNVVFEEQQVNGVRENPVYTLKLYRSLIHYRNNWEYDSFICDENGAIICDEDNSILQ